MPEFTDAQWLHFAQCTYRDHDGVPVPDLDKQVGEAMRQSPAAAAPDLWPLFALLAKIPALVIRGGTSDILSPATLARMQAEKPDLRTLLVSNRGHAPTLDEPPCREAILALLHDVSAPR